MEKSILGIDTTLSNESLFVLTPKMQNFFDVRNITVPSNNSDAFSFVTRYLTESEINPMTKYTVDEAESINLVYDTFCEDEASVSPQVSFILFNLNRQVEVTFPTHNFRAVHV